VKISHLAIGILFTLGTPVWAQQQQPSTWFHPVDSDEVRSYQEAPDPSGKYSDRELKSYEDEQRIDENKHELKSYENERGNKENDSDFSNRKRDYESRDLSDD
jgi:hypothetical protein